MKIKTFLIIGFATLAMLSCHRGPKPPVSQQNLPISMSKPAKGDKAIYGLACMGCTDSVVIILPNQGGDPVKYNILEANRNRQVFGNIEVGDWIFIGAFEGIGIADCLDGLGPCLAVRGAVALHDRQVDPPLYLCLPEMHENRL